MRNWKRVLAGFTAASMLVVPAAAYAGEAETEEEAESQSEEEYVPGSAWDKYEPVDMGGRTIRVAMWWDRYYDSGDTDINDNPDVTDPEIAQMQLDNLRRIEEKYNVKLEFVNVSWDGIKESISTSITAGTPEYDIYTVDLQFGVPAIANGLAMPLSEYAPENSDILNDNKVFLTMEMLDGEYFFTENVLPNGGVMAYNADLIKELNLEDPQELYENGEWTWDKFREMCIAATMDTDGDGADDQFGYGGVYGTSMGFLYANGGTMAPGPEEQLSSPEVIETYNFLYDLYNVDKCAVYYQGTDNDWNNNLYGWANGNILFWGAAAWLLKAGVDNWGADFEYHVVPFPQGPSGDGSSYGSEARNWYMIPVGTKDPQLVYQIFEEYTNWYDNDTSYVFDKSVLEPYFLSEEDIDYSVYCGERSCLDFAEKVGFDLGSFHNSIITGESTVSQAVESYKQVLQDCLDAVFKK